MDTVFKLTLREVGLSVREAAKKVGCRPQTLYKHVSGERTVSPEMAIRYEQKLGIPREVLRPDLWGEESREGAKCQAKP